jgi:3-hydroxyacyl-CoA dehydrogenase
MNAGVIGSGSIGPDLAYGFVSALAGASAGRVHLLDIRKEALDAGVERIKGYVGKGLARGRRARQRYGLVTLCIGGGQGIALVLESIV